MVNKSEVEQKEPYVGRRTLEVIKVNARKDSAGFERVSDYFPDLASSGERTAKKSAAKKPYIGRRTGKVINVNARKDAHGFERVSDYFPDDDSETDEEDEVVTKQAAATTSGDHVKAKETGTKAYFTRTHATKNDTEEQSAGDDESSPDSAFGSTKDDAETASSGHEHAPEDVDHDENGGIQGANQTETSGKAVDHTTSPHSAMADGTFMGGESSPEQENGLQITKKRLTFSTTATPANDKKDEPSNELYTTKVATEQKMPPTATATKSKIPVRKKGTKITHSTARKRTNRGPGAANNDIPSKEVITNEEVAAKDNATSKKSTSAAKLSRTTGTKPVATGTKPVATGTKPVTTGTKPVATGTKPVTRRGALKQPFVVNNTAANTATEGNKAKKTVRLIDPQDETDEDSAVMPKRRITRQLTPGARKVSSHQGSKRTGNRSKNRRQILESDDDDESDDGGERTNRKSRPGAATLDTESELEQSESRTIPTEKPKTNKKNEVSGNKVQMRGRGRTGGGNKNNPASVGQGTESEVGQSRPRGTATSTDPKSKINKQNEVHSNKIQTRGLRRKMASLTDDDESQSSSQNEPSVSQSNTSRRTTMKRSSHEPAESGIVEKKVKVGEKTSEHDKRERGSSGVDTGTVAEQDAAMAQEVSQASDSDNKILVEVSNKEEKSVVDTTARVVGKAKKDSRAKKGKGETIPGKMREQNATTVKEVPKASHKNKTISTDTDEVAEDCLITEDGLTDPVSDEGDDTYDDDDDDDDEEEEDEEEDDNTVKPSSGKKGKTVKVTKKVYKDVADREGLRRGARHRVPPLDYWKNERIEYERRKSGAVVKDIIRMPSPDITKRKRNATKSRRKKESKVKKVENASSDEEMGEIDGEDFLNSITEVDNPVLTVVNPETMKEVQMKILHTSKMLNLQPSVQRSDADDDGDDDDTNQAPLLVDKYFSYGHFGAGQILLRPGADKGVQHVRKDTMLFHVLSGRVLCTVHHQSFLLGKGSDFFVPDGNVYNIKNVNKEKDARLFFTQING